MCTLIEREQRKELCPIWLPQLNIERMGFLTLIVCSFSFSTGFVLGSFAFLIALLVFFRVFHLHLLIMIFPSFHHAQYKDFNGSVFFAFVQLGGRTSSQLAFIDKGILIARFRSSPTPVVAPI